MPKGSLCPPHVGPGWAGDGDEEDGYGDIAPGTGHLWGKPHWSKSSEHQAAGQAPRSHQEQGVQCWAHAELPTWSGCQRAGKGGPAPSRETSPWQGVDEMKHCRMALLAMLECPKCCHRDFSFATGQFLISKGTSPLCRASWLALSPCHCPPWPAPHSFYIGQDVLWCRISLQPVQVSCPSHAPSQCFVHLLTSRTWDTVKPLT